MNNIAQITSILRIVLAVGTPLALYLTAHGIDPTDLVNWIVLGLPIAMGVWGWVANSHANLAVTAGAIPGVKVIVSSAAPAAVQAVAKNPLIKNVHMA